MIEYALPSAAAHAVLHALWQGALIALIAVLAFARIAPGRAALRCAVGMVCLVAMVIAPVATFALYQRGSVVAGAGTTAGATPLVLRGSDWIIVALPVAWLLGASWRLVRQVGGWRVVIALGRRPAPAPPARWQRRLDVLRRAVGIRRPVALRPARASSPFTAHTLRPVIWLPAALWARLPDAQKDALLAHELAHVRRRDWLWNGVQHVLEAVLWFHPAAWWLGRRIRDEREHACDDIAVATVRDPIALAEALAAVAREPAGPEIALAARGGAVVDRVARVLGAPRPARRSSRGLVLGLALSLCASIALAAQIELPPDVLINVRAEASSGGALTPGGFRELIVDAFATQRRYRSTMDARGQVRELYEENGEPRPIDPAVRAWLAELTPSVGWR